ncbi:MAG: glycosyltransferase family 2 protein [Anaerolineae bacterium]|nr:glycosyltransferase family 2 protein [Anaerolineae bacterium]
MNLGVVILNWNAADDTIACLDAVAAWRRLSPQVWVVDNASQGDDAGRIARAHPQVKLIRSDRNRGFAGGNNLALAEALAAGCAAVLLLNNDAAIEEESVAVLMEALQAHPEVGIVGPPLWDSERPAVLLSAGGVDIALHAASHLLDLPDGEPLRRVDHVPGTCVLIRAGVLQAAGLLDEAYFFGGELADLCARARQHGFESAVDGRARAVHRLSRSSELRHTLHVYYVLRNRFLFIRKFHARQRLRLFFLWAAQGLRLALQAALRRQPRRARAALLGVADGLRGRFGGQNERILAR